MRWSSVDQRSSRYAARQYVSDIETEGLPMSNVPSDTERSIGIVKFYNDDKGFGFCQREDGASDVFVHANELRRCGISPPIKKGDRLEFVAETVPGKGPKATSIVKLPNGP